MTPLITSKLQQKIHRAIKAGYNTFPQIMRRVNSRVKEENRHSTQTVSGTLRLMLSHKSLKRRPATEEEVAKVKSTKPCKWAYEVA